MKVGLQQLVGMWESWNGHFFVNEYYGIALPSKDLQIEALRRVIKMLPNESGKLLGLLCRLLRKVSMNQEINKMSPSNLAIVFSPTLLWFVNSGKMEKM